MATRNILIVDDNRELLDVLSILFKSRGYQVTKAADAVSAIGAVQRTKPDVAIVDIALPGGDGFKVINRLQALTPMTGLPVIIITAVDTPENERRAREAGVVAFFKKPVDNDELVAAVQRAVGDAGGAAGGARSLTSDETTDDPTGKRVLVVDDNLEFLKVLKTLLQRQGFVVTQATDAITAVSATRRENPDVILLDIGLPGGDGFLVLNRLRSQIAGNETPVIIITAIDSPENESRARRAGVREFFRKPVNNDELVAAIRRILTDTGDGPPRDGNR
jgi:DNA-binding response OmpR family regulator